jgi:hypothetical protein
MPYSGFTNINIGPVTTTQACIAPEHSDVLMARNLSDQHVGQTRFFIENDKWPRGADRGNAGPLRPKA